MLLPDIEGIDQSEDHKHCQHGDDDVSGYLKSVELAADRFELLIELAANCFELGVNGIEFVIDDYLVGGKPPCSFRCPRKTHRHLGG